ncbi:MAG: hypothetical protein J0H06_03305 [Actinobacteria bacterium]|nr:hypothetical protein [Actinomycetota bacterium]
MKVDDYAAATVAIDVVLIIAGAAAGSYAWSPYLAGALVGAAIGFGVSYILVEILDRLYVTYSDWDRVSRELDERRRRSDEKRWPWKR